MEILIIFSLIMLNGIFSMSEIALVSARKFKLESSAKRGNKSAAKALELANNPNTFLSTVQIGITLIGILTGIFSSEKIEGNLKNAIDKIDLLQPYSHTIAVISIVIVVTFFSIVLGELIPKRIGLMFPETVASIMARPMTIVSIVTRPFIWLLTKTNEFILGLFGLKDLPGSAASEEEIKAMVEESAGTGEIREIEQDIVHRVFALGDRRISELMTHRRDLICFHIDDDLAAIKQKARVEAHSAYPVYRDNSDDLAGIASVKDIFSRDIDAAAFRLADFVKGPIIVQENMPAYNVLEQFRQSKMHYAFIIDEYDIVQGMATMDDLLDALIGDVTEYNQEEYKIVQRDDKTWLVDGQYPFFEFLQYFGISETVRAKYNTVGGLILYKLNHIPMTGEKIRWNRFEFEILDMDGPRIDKILVILIRS